MAEMTRTTFERKIVKNGCSLAVNMSKELKMLGVGKDDVVRVTVELIPEN